MLRHPAIWPRLSTGIAILAVIVGLGHSGALLAGEADSASVQKKTVPAQKKTLAEELPHLPAVEQDKALETFQLEKGFQLELVAAEPQVIDPVDACFDENGRMFVAEFRAYPYALEKDQILPAGKGRTETSVIRLLEDTDGDGFMDRSRIYADKLDWPVSVAPYAGGIFVIDPPELLYFKDTDGDGKADVREVVYTHLGRNNVQGLANNLKWGLDNRIWAASGSNGGSLFSNGKEVLTLGRGDWVFDPRTRQAERASGGVQFGHSMDDWGNRFVCSNSVHIMQVVFEEKYLAGNPWVTAPGVVRLIGKEGAAAPVFRRSPLEPWRIVRTSRRVADPKFRHLPESERVAGGFFTSATGVTIYRGAAYPEEFRGNAFIGDVGGNLVHRKTLHPRGVAFEAVRADQKTEFLASTDTWFRPVNFVNAPDGSLYILDMYRETIEHPIAIPEDIRAHLNLESGNDRGRIYRLVSPAMKRFPVPRLGEATLPELVANLAAPNSWNRETAQRLLWERQDKQAVPLVVELLKTTPSPQGRVHALYTLQGLGALTPELLHPALQDSHPEVRRKAIQLAEPFLKSDPRLVERVLACLDATEMPVRFQAILALGQAPDAAAIPGLHRVAFRLESNADLQAAFLLSVGNRGTELTRILLADPGFLKFANAKPLLLKIVEMVGARPEIPQAIALVETVCQENIAPPLRIDLLQAMAQGTTRRGSSLVKLLDAIPQEHATRRQIGKIFAQVLENADDEKTSLAERRAAIQFMGSLPWSQTASTYASLLTPQVSQELQALALSSLTSAPEPAIADFLIQSWKTFTPALRQQILTLLLSRSDRSEKLLDAMERGDIQRGEIDSKNSLALLNHPQVAIRTRAARLLKNDISSDRARIVASYQPALELSGHVDNGKQVYLQKCALCHRVGTAGFQVGPDLNSVQNRTPADLLIAILDPSRESQANFLSYSVATENGQVYSGIISAESAGSLTLRRAEAQEDVILRDQIDLITSSGKSLMPEGLEKELNPQQVADVIAYIQSLNRPEVK